MILDQSFISVVLDYHISQTNGQQQWNFTIWDFHYKPVVHADGMLIIPPKNFFKQLG